MYTIFEKIVEIFAQKLVCFIIFAVFLCVTDPLFSLLKTKQLHTRACYLVTIFKQGRGHQYTRKLVWRG